MGLATELVKGFRVWRKDKTVKPPPGPSPSGRFAPDAGEGPLAAHRRDPSPEEREQLWRASKYEHLLLRYNHYRNLELLRGELRLAIDRQLAEEQYLAERHPVHASPGSWLPETFAVPPPAPLILFNPHLSRSTEGAEPPFNPLPSLFEKCRDQNAAAEEDLTVTSFGTRASHANDEIAQFYHRELSPRPAAIVTGHFDGQALLVQAAAFGLQEGQVSWAGETLRIGSQSMSLGRIPL